MNRYPRATISEIRHPDRTEWAVLVTPAKGGEPYTTPCNSATEAERIKHAIEASRPRMGHPPLSSTEPTVMYTLRVVRSLWQALRKLPASQVREWLEQLARH